MTKISADASKKDDTCIHNLSLKLRSGVTVVNVKPLFSYDSQNIIIASGADIKVFTVISGECVQTMKYHSRPVVGLKENKKNMLQIFSCSDDGVVVRWDYTGRILQVYNLQTPVTCFYAPSSDKEWFITKQFEDSFRLYSLVPRAKGCKKVRLILKPVLPKENSVDFDSKGKYVASVYKNNLTIYKFETKNIVRHKTGDRNLTCVVFHPSDNILATGDDHGRVIVWNNALHSNHPMRSIYHWHSNPIADLAFSLEGSHIYSGGGESALVKWKLFFSEERSILPRMGASIESIITSKDNKYVMTTHSDNVLQVVDAQRNIVQVIQGLTRSQPLYGKLLPVGLLYNAHLKSLVLNGKPGHLQFYDLKQDKLLFNLDIASKNFISQDREIAVYNIDVQKAALDDSGLWLATTEYWCNKDVSPQIWLKFWNFNLEKQTFTLNTNVYLPHNKDLNCILFKPSDKCSDDDSPLVLTTSNDGHFKIWTLNTIPNESKESWGCEHMGYYRGMIPTSASFSEDGSVLSVAFGRVATLWKVDNLSLKAVLYHKKCEKDIKQLLFGRHAGMKYLICHDGISITAWDCVSFSIAWIVHYEIQLLVADNYSDNIAAFCKDQNLKNFKPNSPQPLDYIKKVSDSRIVCAAFLPSTSTNNNSGCCNEKSQLYFINEAQNLLTVLELDFDEETAPSEKTNIVSNPTWQDPEVLLKAILPTFLIRKKEKEPKETTSVKQDCDDDEGDNDRKIEITFEDDWMSKALSSTEAKVRDFSFLTEKVEFIE